MLKEKKCISALKEKKSKKKKTLKEKKSISALKEKKCNGTKGKKMLQEKMLLDFDSLRATLQ